MPFRYEFSCLLDININRKVNEKLERYGPLVRTLQIMYSEYKSQVASTVIGAMGYVPKSLINYLKMSGFNENESKVLISKLEIKSISDTVKICKTFLNFKDLFRDFNFTWLLLQITFQIIMWCKTPNLGPISIMNTVTLRFCFTFLTLEVCITCYAKKTCICTVGQMRVHLLLSPFIWIYLDYLII